MSDHMDAYLTHIKQIPVRKRIDCLEEFVTGLNLDHIYSVLDKMETIDRSGYRIIIGPKPVQRKIHFKIVTDIGTQVKCPVANGMSTRALNRLKLTEDTKKVTCKKCLAILDSQTKEENPNE
jgi:hypothetical protein